MVDRYGTLRGAVGRRTQLAGALGIAGMVNTGCGTPSATESNSSSSASSTPGPGARASETSIGSICLVCYLTRADEFVSEPRVRMTGCSQVLGICLCRELQRALTARPGER